MKKEKLSIPDSTLLATHIAKNLQSWQTVERNNWVIKFSIYKSNILLLFTSTYTGQTIVRSFLNEDLAVEYINFVVSQDPQEEYIL
jgi:lipopolysaccharide assembly outer membrane protein LptD (OstA)